MNLKKIIPELLLGITDAGLDTELKDIHQLCIPKIKSGADLFVIAPEDSGKTTAIVMAVIQQLKKAVNDNPRAIIMVESKEKAFAMQEQFEIIGKHTNLRVFTVFEKGKIQFQKDTIYEGLDVLIGTSKRVNELISITGVPLNDLKMLIVDDAETFFQLNQQAVIYRIAEGVEKAQFLIFANYWIDKFDLLSDRIMKNPMIIEIESTNE